MVWTVKRPAYFTKFSHIVDFVANILDHKKCRCTVSVPTTMGPNPEYRGGRRDQEDTVKSFLDYCASSERVPSAVPTMQANPLVISIAWP